MSQPDGDANGTASQPAISPESGAWPDITVACPRCGHQPEVYSPRCPRCGADLAEMFSATYRVRPAPWARWVAWVILVLLLATVGLAVVAILLGGTGQPSP